MITRPISRPVTLPVTRDVHGAAGNIWNPRALFALGESGCIHDQSDVSTLFQDSAGTSGVTAPGQTLGRILDKRFGLALGGELISNGSFDATTAGWTAVNSSLSVVGGKLVITAAGGVQARATQTITTEAGKTYRASVVARKPNGLTPSTGMFGGGGSSTYTISTTDTPLAFYFTASAASTVVTLEISGAPAAGVAAEFDSVSVRELPGSHGIQATPSARGVWRAAPARIDYDGVDDALNIAFASSLGSTCTVARSIPGTGAQILTAQTIGTSFTDNVDNCGLVIINRALTAAETANLTRYLNQKAGV